MTPPANTGPVRFLERVEVGVERQGRSSNDVGVDPLATSNAFRERTQEHDYGSP